MGLRHPSRGSLPLLAAPLLLLHLAARAGGQPMATTAAQDGDRWFIAADAEVERRARLLAAPNENRAKNVIVLIADGNGISANYATRLWAGQNGRPPFAADRPGRATQDDVLATLPPGAAAGAENYGDEHVLTHELFPHSALSKTYNTNGQTPDSAGTASAINTGVKCKSGVLGVSEGLRRGHCEDVPSNYAETFAEAVKANQGKKVGIVTTARLTHATPAAVYTHIEDRNVESGRAAAPGSGRTVASNADDDTQGTPAWELIHSAADVSAHAAPGTALALVIL